MNRLKKHVQNYRDYFVFEILHRMISAVPKLLRGSNLWHTSEIILNKGKIFQIHYPLKEQNITKISARTQHKAS